MSLCKWCATHNRPNLTYSNSVAIICRLSKFAYVVIIKLLINTLYLDFDSF